MTKFLDLVIVMVHCYVKSCINLLFIYVHALRVNTITFVAQSIISLDPETNISLGTKSRIRDTH